MILALVLGGCATPGPLHVYSLPSPQASNVLDRGGEKNAEVPSFLAPDEQLTGFAYDPFTDHFFLRLAPGNVIRVIDRPARAIKREFTISGLLGSGGGDLAVHPRDGHMFLLHASEPAVSEITRLGKRVRQFSLQGTSAAAGIAFDARANRLLVLSADGERITAHDLEGRTIGDERRLARPVDGSLAFDSERREFYAPLRTNGNVIGVFDENGKLVRTLEQRGTFVDVGPRSFVRVF